MAIDNRNSGWLPMKIENGGSFHGKMWLFTRGYEWEVHMLIMIFLLNPGLIMGSNTESDLRSWCHFYGEGGRFRMSATTNQHFLFQRFLGLWTSGESITDHHQPSTWCPRFLSAAPWLSQLNVCWFRFLLGVPYTICVSTIEYMFIIYSYPRWTSPSPRANWSLFHTDSHRFQMIYVKTVGNAMLSLLVCDMWWLIFIDQENWIETPSWWSAGLAPIGLSCPPEILPWARHASFSGA